MDNQGAGGTDAQATTKQVTVDPNGTYLRVFGPSPPVVSGLLKIFAALPPANRVFIPINIIRIKTRFLNKAESVYSLSRISDLRECHSGCLDYFARHADAITLIICGLPVRFLKKRD